MVVDISVISDEGGQEWFEGRSGKKGFRYLASCFEHADVCVAMRTRRLLLELVMKQGVRSKRRLRLLDGYRVRYPFEAISGCSGSLNSLLFTS